MIESKICPFCNKENLCEVNISNKNCWCNSIKVPKKLREILPEEKRMKACICKKCILSFLKDSDSFIKLHHKI